MKTTTKTLSALALGVAIIGTGVTGVYAYQNPEVTNKFLPSFAQEEQDSPEEIAAEKAESAKLAPLAKITASQAKTTALANHSGNINNVILEDENGTIVYGLEYANGDEVKVDATTGDVVTVEKAGEEHMDHLPRERDDDQDGQEEK